MHRLCLYVLGSPPPAIAERHGDYVRWFSRLAEGAGAALTAVDGLSPDPAIARPGWTRQFDGIVLTGSPASVAGSPPWRQGWIETAAGLVLDAAAAGTPVLGVCFGHQLVAAAFGAEVAQTRAWHLSTQQIELTDAGRDDPLFAGVDRRFQAQQVHEDAVQSGHPDVVVLARGARCVEAIAAGDAVRGIQFHPELSAEVTRAYVHQHAPEIGATEAERLAATAADCPASQVIFDNFVREFAGRA